MNHVFLSRDYLCVFSFWERKSCLSSFNILLQCPVCQGEMAFIAISHWRVRGGNSWLTHSVTNYYCRMEEWTCDRRPGAGIRAKLLHINKKCPGPYIQLQPMARATWAGLHLFLLPCDPKTSVIEGEKSKKRAQKWLSNKSKSSNGKSNYTQELGWWKLQVPS